MSEIGHACTEALLHVSLQRSQREQRLFQRQPDGDVEIPVRRPDGDVELQDAGKGFVVPPCPLCGGILKPDVTFFGDAIPPARSARSAACLQQLGHLALHLRQLLRVPLGSLHAWDMHHGCCGVIELI